MDFDADGDEEMLAGSDDYSVRVFKGEELIFDISEKGKVAQLSKITGNVFAYALANGNVGSYIG